MKKLMSTILVCLTLTIATDCKAGIFDQFYTIQVKALPMGQYKEGLELYTHLKNKGYLPYFYKIKLKDKWWFRLRVGYFKDRNQARMFGEVVKEKEGLDYYVDKAKIFVDRFNNTFDIITTPSAVWINSDNSRKILYALNKKTVNKSGILFYTRALISPTGKQVVFYYDEKIIGVDVESGRSTVFKGDVYDSAPKWSPDGNYIAYLDYVEWEVETSLWLIKSDGTQDTCIVKHGKTQRAVKSFQWHPYRNSIFFVEGYAYGTVTVGGNMYLLDVSEKKRRLVIEPPKKYDEIARGFHIKNGKLHYKLAHFDDNMMNVTFTEHSIPLAILEQ